ncbi:MAG TPA: hypothetical protein VER96_39185 [Polyangiaceae bacterium]|nr:hypothetical protein [Polyangiaceae bacterium]
MGAAISNYGYLVRSFVDGQALGWCLLAALAATCGWALFLLYRIVRRQSAQSAVVWTWCAALLALALSGARIALARQEVLTLLLRELQTDSWQRSRLVAANLARLFMTQLFTSSVMIPAMLVMLVGVLTGRSKVRERWLVALAASSLLLLAVAVRAETLIWASSPCSEGRPTCWFEFASDSVSRLQRAARHAVFAAALAWAVALVVAFRTARTRSMTDGRVTLASTALLLLGIGAFWLTRAEHADARHLLPPDSDLGQFWFDARLQRQLPPAKAGCSAREAPVIEVHASGVLLDGQERATAEQLRAALARKRELWEQINPEGKFPGLVLLAVARDARTSAVRPWQLAAEQAGYAKIGAVLQVPTVMFQTRTVGTLALERTCAEVWEVDGAGLERAFAHFETWGELVAAGGVAPPDPYPRRSERSRCGSLSAPASPTVASLFHKARILRNRDALDALLVQAKNGTPERIALRINGTGGVMCECPPFSIPLSAPDEPVPSLLAIPMQNAANFGLRRTLLNFTAVGYFSGAWIDTFEYLHTQGDDNPSTDDETRFSYRELTTEFCLEALCYWPREFELSGDLRASSHEDAADMATLGIPKCRRQ